MSSNDGTGWVFKRWTRQNSIQFYFNFSRRIPRKLNMFCKNFVKCLCLFALIGLAASKKIDISKFDPSRLHKPNFSSMSAAMRPFWDDSICDDFEDLDSFINPENCKGFLICWEGTLWEMECEEGDLFDREFGRFFYYKRWWNDFC